MGGSCTSVTARYSHGFVRMVVPLVQCGNYRNKMDKFRRLGKRLGTLSLALIVVIVVLSFV